MAQVMAAVLFSAATDRSLSRQRYAVSHRLSSVLSLIDFPTLLAVQSWQNKIESQGVVSYVVFQ